MLGEPMYLFSSLHQQNPPIYNLKPFGALHKSTRWLGNAPLFSIRLALGVVGKVKVSKVWPNTHSPASMVYFCVRVCVHSNPLEEKKKGGVIPKGQKAPGISTKGKTSQRHVQYR